MAISARLKKCLDGAKVKYRVAKHAVVYTAQEIAAVQHVPGRYLAKSVLVTTDRGPVLAVLPAVYLIDLKKLKAFLKSKTLSIAKEADIQLRFPDVEVGAMSPFGNLYEVAVVVDRDLGGSEEIVFNGGSHTDTITMRYRDFAALVKPKAGAFGMPRDPKSRVRKTAKKKPAAKKKRAAKSKRTAKKP